MNSNLFRLHGICLGDEDLTILQVGKKIMEHDGGEVLKIHYRDLTDCIK